MKPRAFVVLLLVVIGLSTAYYFYSIDNTSGLVLVGTVDANQVIVSPKIMGRIEKLLVDEGSVVKQGDLIAVLDTAELLAQKQQAVATYDSLRSRIQESRSTEQATSGTTSSDVVTAQARLRSARSQLAEAEADLERQKLDTQRTVGLADAGVASIQDRDRATLALKQSQAHVQTLRDQIGAAEADLKTTEARTHQANAAQSTVSVNRAAALSAQAQIAQMDAKLGYTKVFAPVSGTVSVRATREGEVVNPGTPIVTIVDLSDSWVRAAIPETYADKIRIGDTLQVRLPSGRQIQGKVIFKNVENDFATQRDVGRAKRDIRTFALKLSVDNSDRTLAPGLTAEVIVPNSVLKGTVTSSAATSANGNGK